MCVQNFYCINQGKRKLGRSRRRWKEVNGTSVSCRNKDSWQPSICLLETDAVVFCCRKCSSLSILRILNEFCAAKNPANASLCSGSEAFCFCNEPLRSTAVCKETVDISGAHHLTLGDGGNNGPIWYRTFKLWPRTFCLFVCVCAHAGTRARAKQAWLCETNFTKKFEFFVSSF